MPSILKASLPVSGSPAKAVALGYSKLCQNLALVTWSRLYLLQNWSRLRLGSVSMFFQTMKIQRQLGHQILKVFAFPLESVVLLAGGISCHIATQTLLVCFLELFGPRVEVVGFDAFASTQSVDCDLATKAFEDYMDLLFWSVFPASCRSDLTNEPSDVLAPFFSRLILVLSVLGHVRSFPEDTLCFCPELALPTNNLH